MFVKENPFQKYIDEKLTSVRQFGMKHKMTVSSLYPIYNGTRKPQRTLALRIQKATKGAVSLESWKGDP